MCALVCVLCVGVIAETGETSSETSGEFSSTEATSSSVGNIGDWTEDQLSSTNSDQIISEPESSEETTTTSKYGQNPQDYTAGQGDVEFGDQPSITTTSVESKKPTSSKTNTNNNGPSFKPTVILIMAVSTVLMIGCIVALIVVNRKSFVGETKKKTQKAKDGTQLRKKKNSK